MVLESPGFPALLSPSDSPPIAPGLATNVGLAVAVCAELPKFARLVTLAGLVSIRLGSVLLLACTWFGMLSAFAAIDMPSLMTDVETGASCGLLIPAPPPAMSDDKALCPGFSLIAVALCLALSSCIRRMSSTAAAPVIGEGVNPPFRRGDFAEGEVFMFESPGYEMGLGGVSTPRLRFNDLARVSSGSAEVVGRVATASERAGGKTGATAGDNVACSDAMRSKLVVSSC